MAKKLRPYGENSIYDVYILEKELFIEKNKMMQLRKQDKELQECHFMPNIKKYLNH